MFVQGQRSAMFLWQCSSKVVAMFLRLDAFHTHTQKKMVFTPTALLSNVSVAVTTAWK